MSVDVCIIGAGVAGAILASELAQVGKSVVLLDTGPRWNYPDPERYELVRRREYPWRWWDDGRDGFENPDGEFPVNSGRIKAVGGTTLHWTAITPRLQPSDLRMRSLYGLGADWPFDYDELEPWYLRAEQELGVSGEFSPGEPPRSAPFPLPAHPLGYFEREVMAPAFAATGYSVGYRPLAIRSEPGDGRPRCERFGTCRPECPTGAKYNALVHVRKAEATGNVEVRANSHVRRLRLAGRRQIDYVEYIDTTASVMRRQEARLFVLAAGAVENARLLLLSAHEGSSDGLANVSGQVGRNLTSHTSNEVTATSSRPTGAYRAGFGSAISWALYQDAGLPNVGNLQLTLGARGPHPATIAEESGLWGRELQSHVLNTFGRSVVIALRGDVLPRPENGVRLSSSRRDRYDDPIPVVSLNMGDFEHRTAEYGEGEIRRIFSNMGVTDIRSGRVGSTGLVPDFTHQLGTTRMGTDPHSSVCDAWGRCHDLDNLYVAGGSLFPTSGCSNPTLTIAALAFRSAGRLSSAL